MQADRKPKIYCTYDATRQFTLPSPPPPPPRPHLATCNQIENCKTFHFFHQIYRVFRVINIVAGERRCNLLGGVVTRRKHERPEESTGKSWISRKTRKKLQSFLAQQNRNFSRRITSTYMGWASLLEKSPCHEPAINGPCTMGVTHKKTRKKGAKKLKCRRIL